MRWRDVKNKKHQIVQQEEVVLPQVKYAGFWSRLLAVFVDTFMILTPISILLGFMFGYESMKNPELNPEAGVLQMVAYAVITILFWSRSGQTPGKKFARIKLVDAKTLKQPPLWKLYVRYAGYFVTLISIIGFVVMFMRPDKRTPHDLLSGTAIVYE